MTALVGKEAPDFSATAYHETAAREAYPAAGDGDPENGW